MKLTKKRIDSLPFSDDFSVTFHWDESAPGLGLKISATKKVFVAQGKVRGKTCRVTLGTYGKITLDQARDMAKKAASQMLQGVNPNDEKKREKALQVTMGKAVDDFLAARKLKPSTRADIEKHMRVSFPDWQKKPVASITRKMVSNRFLKLSKGAPVQTNLSFRYLRSILNYARATYRDTDDMPLLPENPVQAIGDQRLWNRVQPRNGKIPLDKIGKAWNILTEYRICPTRTTSGRSLGDATAFIMLTGCRIGEACNLKWENVNLEEKWWHIHDPKNRNSVTLPLPEMLCNILNERPRKSEFVFPSRSGVGHITEIRTPLKKLSEAAGVKINAHDLRRTFRSIAGGIRIPFDLCKLLLNHTSQDVTTMHYTETQDLRYLRDDIEKIARWVVEQGKIAAADNVVLMKKLA